MYYKMALAAIIAYPVPVVWKCIMSIIITCKRLFVIPCFDFTQTSPIMWPDEMTTDKIFYIWPDEMKSSQRPSKFPRARPAPGAMLAVDWGIFLRWAGPGDMHQLAMIHGASACSKQRADQAMASLHSLCFTGGPDE